MTEDSERRELSLKRFFATAVVSIVPVELVACAPSLAIRVFATAAIIAVLFLPLFYAVVRDGPASIPRWAYRGPHQ